MLYYIINIIIIIIVTSAWHPVIHLVGTGDIVLVDLVLTGQTNFATMLDLSLPTSGERAFYWAMVQ